MARQRDYAAEYRRKQELAFERTGDTSPYRERKALKEYELEKRLEAAEKRRDRRLIGEAWKWTAFKVAFNQQRPLATAEDARLFLSGYGTMGKSGQPNRRGGYVATRQQREDRDTFNRRYVLHASIEAWGRRFDISEAFWDVWREQYADTYL